MEESPIIITWLFIKAMQHINLRPLQHYNELIAHLGPWKMHQIILLLIMVAYWIVSGLSEAIFELTLARKFLL